MLATCKVFAHLLRAAGLEERLKVGYRLSYTTNIPRMVGLSGSSALIIAAFKSLLQFHNLTIASLAIPKESETFPLLPINFVWILFEHFKGFPQVILDIEKNELGISAGLQDRVIQTYGGIVHMDFSSVAASGVGVYTTPVTIAELPHFYLAYNYKAGLKMTS